MDIHTAGSRREGVPEAKLEALDRAALSPLFSSGERAALRLAEAMTGLPVDVPASLVDELRGHFGERGLVELAAIIAAENFRARFNRVFAIEAHGFAAAEAGPASRPA